MRAYNSSSSTGAYKGKVYSGQYGDLAATVAAILLEPEARSVMLDYDPTFGRLREPLLKVLAPLYNCIKTIIVTTVQIFFIIEDTYYIPRVYDQYIFMHTQPVCRFLVKRVINSLLVLCCRSPSAHNLGMILVHMHMPPT